jgi:hypothetical protein
LTLRKNINRLREKIFKKLINRKQIKRVVIIAFTTHLILFSSAYIIAKIFSDYSITENLISSLSGSLYTPTPYLIDIAFISIGILLIPYFFYLEHYLTPDLQNISRKKIRIAEAAFIFGLMGSVSYIGVGIFGIDFNIFIHDYFAELFFLGFICNAFFTGIFIILYETDISRIIGVYGIFGPLISYIIFKIFTISIIEWILYISILLWLIIHSFFALRKK